MGGQFNRQWPGGRNQYGITEEDVAELRQHFEARQTAICIGCGCDDLHACYDEAEDAVAGRVEHPTGRGLLASIRLSASMDCGAKEVLEEEDLIRKNEQGLWELVDPVMAEYIRQIAAS